MIALILVWVTLERVKDPSLVYSFIQIRQRIIVTWHEMIIFWVDP